MRGSTHTQLTNDPNYFGSSKEKMQRFCHSFAWNNPTYGTLSMVATVAISPF